MGSLFYVFKDACGKFYTLCYFAHLAFKYVDTPFVVSSAFLK